MNTSDLRDIQSFGGGGGKAYKNKIDKELSYCALPDSKPFMRRTPEKFTRSSQLNWYLYVSF